MSTKHTPGQATDSFGRPLPSEAIPITRLMPPCHREVILYIEDLSVAIKGKPVVGWNSGTKEAPWWFSGVPGNYIALRERKWSVSHWAPLPGDEETRAAIAKATGSAS